MQQNSPKSFQNESLLSRTKWENKETVGTSSRTYELRQKADFGFVSDILNIGYNDF